MNRIDLGPRRQIELFQHLFDDLLLTRSQTQRRIAKIRLQLAERLTVRELRINLLRTSDPQVVQIAERFHFISRVCAAAKTLLHDRKGLGVYLEEYRPQLLLECMTFDLRAGEFTPELRLFARDAERREPTDEIRQR